MLIWIERKKAFCIFIANVDRKQTNKNQYHEENVHLTTQNTQKIKNVFCFLKVVDL